ncbi:MAG: DUF4349 domain-containing protein [Oscillochloridaceae bacterium]|nr:DUF4349 domain-containing protein [Chloroflexaceae bacterium]MDW8389621.1 DUF4349 domain-containing protein [Oscillochloridaceae bacterium]
MRHQRLLLILLLAALFLAGCGAIARPEGAPAAGMAMSDTTEARAPMSVPTAAPAAIESSSYHETAGSAPGAPDTAVQPGFPRLVIKTATLSIEVEDVAEAERRISARAQELGGYVVSLQTNGAEAGRMAVITVRVPAQRFDEALSGVEGLARKVLSRTISGDDVTEEFVDLESQLRNLEATRDRLLELLGRASEVEDALQVNQALTEVQGQIEQIQGRMKYLQQSAAFSTITVEVRPVPPPPAIIEEDGWKPLHVAREALRGLITFGQELVNLGIILLVWSPVWLPVLLLARYGWLRLRGGRGGRAAA